MQKLLFAMSFLFLLSITNINTYAVEDNVSYFIVDTTRSYVRWEAEKVTGGHFGKVFFETSKLELINGKISDGIFSVKMNTITCIDIEKPETNAQLVRHLKSPDFFDVWKYPLAKLKIIRTIPNFTAKVGSPNYTIIADLHIKDSTKTITFPAEVRLSDREMKAVAEFTFDRTNFDIRFNSKKFFPSIGDKMIKDPVTVKAVLYLIREKDFKKMSEED